jgi:hypothetical protein
MSKHYSCFSNIYIENRIKNKRNSRFKPNGVVVDAAIPPASDPHNAPCHGDNE